MLSLLELVKSQLFEKGSSLWQDIPVESVIENGYTPNPNFSLIWTRTVGLLVSTAFARKKIVVILLHLLLLLIIIIIIIILLLLVMVKLPISVNTVMKYLRLTVTQY